MNVGIFTTLIAGLAATLECDTKKIIALSTLRQLGLIVTSLGLGARSLCFAHLNTHAAFKALLFLAATLECDTKKNYCPLHTKTVRSNSYLFGLRSPVHLLCTFKYSCCIQSLTFSSNRLVYSFYVWFSGVSFCSFTALKLSLDSGYHCYCLHINVRASVSIRLCY